MNKFALMLSTILVVVIFGVGENTNAQSNDELILSQKITLDVVQANLYTMCSYLAMENIPVGFEAAATFDLKKNKRDVVLKRGTLRDALDNLVKQEPEYSWKIVDGVINVFPVKSRDPVIGDIINMKIDRFQQSKEAGKSGLRQMLEGISSVANYSAVHEIQITYLIGGFDLQGEAEIVDVNLTDTNLRTILNTIVVAKKNQLFWSIIRLDGSIVVNV